MCRGSGGFTSRIAFCRCCSRPCLCCSTCWRHASQLVTIVAILFFQGWNQSAQLRKTMCWNNRPSKSRGTNIFKLQCWLKPMPSTIHSLCCLLGFASEDPPNGGPGAVRGCVGRRSFEELGKFETSGPGSCAGCFRDCWLPWTWTGGGSGLSWWRSQEAIRRFLRERGLPGALAALFCGWVRW